VATVLQTPKKLSVRFAPFLLALGLCCSVTASAAPAGRALAEQQRNERITGRYYATLIAPGAPRLAELTLFTTLLPKGGDLHHHYSGALYAETYLDWVGAKNYCIYSDSDAALGIKKYTIEAKPDALSAPARALCIGADAVRQNNAFYRELLSVWSDKDYGNHFHQQLPPDQQFFNTFGYFGPISGYSYHDGLQALKARALAENVQYLETMLASPWVVIEPSLAARINGLGANAGEAEIDAAFAAYADFLAGDAQAQQNLEKYVSATDSAAAGLDDEHFTLRFQSYVSRNSPPGQVFAGLYAAFSAAQASRRIVGVNIVGPENGIVAMRDYALHMKMFRFLKRRFPEVKLALHAGELALGMVPPEGLQDHIALAVNVAGAQRIGHGIDIAHEADADRLLAELKKRRIAIEVNLTSNAFILGVQGDAHPLLLYRRQGVPFVISTDDAGVSRNNLSGEYLLYASRYRPSYAELKRTVADSIRYAFLDEAEKRVQLARLAQRFAAFEARIAALAGRQ
jgi:adenosine deaminase/adenosine deaminase CECR1